MIRIVLRAALWGCAEPCNPPKEGSSVGPFARYEKVLLRAFISGWHIFSQFGNRLELPAEAF